LAELFDELLVEATDTALTTTVGESVAKAIKFYMDLSLVSKDIDRFRRQLNKFVPGSKLLENQIKRNLAESLDADRTLVISTDADLKDFVESCRAEYSSMK
jgi:hypothetical protein